MTNKFNVAFALCLGIAASMGAHAQQPQLNPQTEQGRIAARLAPVLEGLAVEKITPTRHANLYEVLTPEGIFYTDKNGSFLIFGAALVDTKTKVNLTEKRLNELSTFTFKDLPFQDAIKVVKGNGSRRMAVFEDPNCGYCKKLMQELVKIDNVTIYTFLIPVLGPDSVVKSKAVWCAKDQAKAWTGYMSGAAPLPASPTEQCETPFERNAVMQRKLRITGTPALLFDDNTKVPGFITAGAIEARLKK